MTDFEYIDMEVEVEVEFGTFLLEIEIFDFFCVYLIVKTNCLLIAIKSVIAYSLDLWMFESDWKKLVTVQDVIDFVKENAGSRKYRRLLKRLVEDGL